MKFSKVFFALVMTILLIACSDDNGKNDEGHYFQPKKKPIEAIDSIDGQVRYDKQLPADTIEILYMSYLTMKNALIDEGSEITQNEAKKFVETFNSLANDTFTKDVLKNVLFIANTNNIDEQRKYFSSFSNAFFALLVAQERGEKKSYLQFCPMAFKNTGAFWISDETSVLNPYFGDKMLRCGFVAGKF